MIFEHGKLFVEDACKIVAGENFMCVDIWWCVVDYGRLWRSERVWKRVK